MPGKRAGRRGGVGGGDRRRRRAGRAAPARVQPAREVPRRETVRMYTRRPLARRRAGACARTCGPAHVVDGPAIIAEKNATTVVEPGWQARVTALDHLVLRPHRAARRARARSAPASTR